MASLPTVPCLTIGRHRDIARSVARVLAPHGFTVNGILSMDPWSNSELASALRVLEPRPQVLLLGGGYSDEDAEKAQAVFDEYTKEMDIANGKMVRVAPGVVEKDLMTILAWDPTTVLERFYNGRAKIAEVPSVDPQYVNQALPVAFKESLRLPRIHNEPANSKPKEMADPILPTSLQEALIPALPASGYYIPDFITPKEEAHLIEKINAVPLPTWKHLSHRRLQAHPSPLSSSNTLLAANLPAWLSDPVISRLLSIPVAPDTNENIFSNSPHGRPNHCLINEYQPGQGIHPHEDGDAYYPVVATISLGSQIVLDVRPKRGASDGAWRILQEPRSLLITTGELYTECLHGIDGVKIDEDVRNEKIVNWALLGNKRPFKEGSAERETRISLTFRDVKKVQKLGKAFGALGRR